MLREPPFELTGNVFALLCFEIAENESRKKSAVKSTALCIVTVANTSLIM